MTYSKVIDTTAGGCMLFSVCTLFFWEKAVDIFKLPFVRQLSDEEVGCLIHCPRYDMYYYYRKCYEANSCPLCELHEIVYPRLTDTIGKGRRQYFNVHWTMVIDTFEKNEGVAQSLLMVRNEHVGTKDELTIASGAFKMELQIRVDRYLEDHFGDTYGTWISSRGTKTHTVDPVYGHANCKFLIPKEDRDEDLRYPVCKGLIRRREIEERALGHAIRYASGEIPERFKAAP